MNPMQVLVVLASVIVLLSDGVTSAPSTVDAAAEAAREQLLKPFLGVTYRLTKADNSLSDVYEDLGYSFEQIQEALKMKPTLKLTEKSKTYTLERKEGGFGDFTYSFPLTTESAADMSDYVTAKFFNQETSVKVTQEENVIKQSLLFTADSDEVESALFEYEFSKNELKVTITTGRHVAVETYVKEG